MVGFYLHQEGPNLGKTLCPLSPVTIRLDAQFGTPYPRSAGFDTDTTHHKKIMNILQTLQQESLTLARHGGHHRTAPIIKHATQTNHSNSSITDRTTGIYSDIIGWKHIIG